MEHKITLYWSGNNWIPKLSRHGTQISLVLYFYGTLSASTMLKLFQSILTPDTQFVLLKSTKFLRVNKPHAEFSF